MTPEQQIKRLEAQIAALVKAAKQVLSDIDDDGVAERNDMGVLALRAAVADVSSREIIGEAGTTTEAEDFPMSDAEFESRLNESMSAMDADAAMAMEKLMQWLAERPKDAAPLSQEEMHQLVSDTRQEIIRQRLGGKVGQILQFPGTR